MCLGIEGANGLDLVVEEVDAQRLARAHRKHIDQRATHGAFAGTHHLRHLGVAGLREPCAKGVARQAIAFGEQQRMRVDVARRRQALQQGRERDDDDTAREAGQFIERSQALRNDVGVRRKAVVGERFPVGEGQHGTRSAEKEVQLRLHPVEGARGFRDQQERPGGAAHGFGDGEGRSAAIELTPADPFPW